ncbi:unnamed protein product [Rotaria socialis]|uniref:RING-type E3 ubiquitin-protein ligase PPIL2 n=3 Tax=Rotaria socialis TaxID=392032 RepID=A0A818Q6V8_9BILA|nr:unnamed protein product [Rotaria socialis]CAF3355010.1 unnamed protein product [Rotaria socialis]CAF3604621.1 unnamed protein product [Rotaria socialis]CAF3634799.1 unnamed protein product [Rotaria socialis]CAF4454472.1 unnamed protein product [Rotaria socialis]
MGKKQHQSDKLYLTTTEWKNSFGGFKGTTKSNADFRRLPFNCCSISFLPVENPYCTPNGIIFDLASIVPFLKKFGRNPVTGEKLEAKQLIKLNFHKNAKDEIHCPITFKVLTESSYIVAIRPSGNVYSYDAIERLNIKTNTFNDLLTNEPFKRDDIITIQDPKDLDKFNIQKFAHLKNEWKLDDEDEKARRTDPNYFLKSINHETAATLEQMKTTKLPEFVEKSETSIYSNKQIRTNQQKLDETNMATYSTGRLSSSFTSTSMDPVTVMEAAVRDENEIRYTRIKNSKKKGYARLVTNVGVINIELDCDLCPQTCENFIKHCANKYYVGSLFHRSIKNFIVQGGDPTGTGSGGKSIWNKPFRDECNSKLQHTGRGMLSMANSGPNTNKSQFFFTYRSCKGLNGKHTVFGRIVGGIETLSAMEAIPTDNKDRPQSDIVIEDTIVFVNPYDEVDAELKAERERQEKREVEEEKATGTIRSVKSTKSSTANDTTSTSQIFRSGVGKYIPNQVYTNAKKVAATTDEDNEYSQKKKRKLASTSSGGTLNFNQW